MFLSNLRIMKDEQKTKNQLIEELNQLRKQSPAHSDKSGDLTHYDHESLFRSLFEYMSCCAAIYEAVDEGTDFVFKDFNRAAEKTELISREQVIGRRVTEVFPGIKEFGLLEELKKVWATGDSGYYPATFYQDDRIAGWRENHIFKLPTGEIVVIYDDITERKRQQEELERKNAELEQFAYTVSHDLKSPLVTIQGFIELLQKSCQNKQFDRIDQYINHITNAANQMNDLLGDLLQLSRIGRTEEGKSCINMNELVREVKEALNGYIRKTGAEVRICNEMPVIYGEKVRMREVMQNLMENSLKYMGDQQNPCIEIGSYSQNNNYVFYVKDNGMGIDPKVQEEIFNVFGQLDKKSEGTGVGLSLVQKIIEYHNGKVWVESQGKNKGATFKFCIPIS